MATRTLAAAVAVALLAGCAPHQWAAAPGTDPTTFEPQAAKCRIFSKSTTPGMTAFGPPLLIAAASIRHDEDLAQQYDDCMIVAGWRIVK